MLPTLFSFRLQVFQFRDSWNEVVAGPFTDIVNITVINPVIDLVLKINGEVYSDGDELQLVSYFHLN